jgi:hypothetical protein
MKFVGRSKAIKGKGNGENGKLGNGKIKKLIGNGKFKKHACHIQSVV